MTKSHLPKNGIRIGKMRLRGRMLRDLLNSDGPILSWTLTSMSAAMP